MARDRKTIDIVRNNIASAVYNDCLPTSLTTSSLKDICFQYDNYRKATDEKGRTGALRQMAQSIELINRQSRNSGTSRDILYLKDDSPESVHDLGETIAVIYAIPFKAKSTMDYVGYAHGMAESKRKNPAYDSFAPDDYLNQCSIAILENGTERDAQDIMQKMGECADSAEYLASIQNGEITGDEQGALNLISSRVKSMDEEIKTICGVKPQHNDNCIVSEVIASSMKECINFSAIGAVDRFREDGMSYGSAPKYECGIA